MTNSPKHRLTYFSQSVKVILRINKSQRSKINVVLQIYLLKYSSTLLNISKSTSRYLHKNTLFSQGSSIIKVYIFIHFSLHFLSQGWQGCNFIFLAIEKVLHRFLIGSHFSSFYCVKNWTHIIK